LSFGSRSALYAAFLRFEGMTPAEWREHRRRPGPETTAEQ
jgi:AraC-like DNA-binding protein